MMNFIPDDPTKEDGANKVWTGKLMEWGMQSDAVYYQQLVKSKVISKNMINLDGTPASSSVLSTSSKVTTRTVFGDIWSAIKTIVEAIGLFFGVPGSYGFTGPYDFDVTWCQFLWGLFCGGGGTGGISPYDVVYSAYIPGYDMFPDGTVNWDAYLGGSGGNSDPCSTSYTAVVSKSSAVSATGKAPALRQVQGGCNGTQIVVTTAMVINYTCVNYNLNTDQQVWLNQHTDAYYALTDFVNSDVDLSNDYYDAIDFLNFSINFLMNNSNISINDFMNDFTSSIDGSGDPNRGDHPLPASHLPPLTMPIQVGNYCVFYSMSFIANYFGTSNNPGRYIKAYFDLGRQTNSPLPIPNLPLSDAVQNGVVSLNLHAFVSYYFTSTPTVDVLTALGNGHPLIATIPTDDPKVGHEVMIMGWNNDATYEFFDSAIGGYRHLPPSQFSAIEEIAGVKLNP